MYTFSNYTNAIAHIKGGVDAPTLSGEIEFYQKNKNVLVIAQVSGLPNTNTSGFFALHIHEGNNCIGEGFPETGMHYNPSDKLHPMHAGDLPPLLSCNGKAYLAVLTNRFTVEEIIGRTVIIHSHPDDFTSQPSGNAGNKIACGIISLKK